MESRTPRSRPRPRTQKNSEAKNQLFKDRPFPMLEAKAQAHHFASVLQLQKKRSSRRKSKFSANEISDGLKKKKSSSWNPKLMLSFLWLFSFFTHQKIVLSSSFEVKKLSFEATGRDFKLCPLGLHLWFLFSAEQPTPKDSCKNKKSGL